MSPEIPNGKKRIDIYLDEDLEKQFKEQVFKRKGMKKGNISESVQEAILLWMTVETPTQGRRARWLRLSPHVGHRFIGADERCSTIERGG